MEYVEHVEPRPEPMSIARCRDLLGEDAELISDQDIEDIRRHAEVMACIVFEMYREQCRASEWNCAAKRTLPESTNGSTLRIMVGAVIYVRVSTKEQTGNPTTPDDLERWRQASCRRRHWRHRLPDPQSSPSTEMADRHCAQEAFAGRQGGTTA